MLEKPKFPRIFYFKKTPLPLTHLHHWYPIILWFGNPHTPCAASRASRLCLAAAAWNKPQRASAVVELSSMAGGWRFPSIPPGCWTHIWGWGGRGQATWLARVISSLNVLKNVCCFKSWWCFPLAHTEWTHHRERQCRANRWASTVADRIVSVRPWKKLPKERLTIGFDFGGNSARALFQTDTLQSKNSSKSSIHGNNTHMYTTHNTGTHSTKHKKRRDRSNTERTQQRHLRVEQLSYVGGMNPCRHCQSCMGRGGNPQHKTLGALIWR